MRHLAAKRFVEALNAQIGSELSAHNQYVACAAYYDGLTMPQIEGIEDFVARETGKADTDPTAPAQAGANA